MTERRYITQREAEALCDVHYDTIRRARKAGKLPNSTQRDGAWHVAVSDLVDAGLLDPLAGDERLEQAAARSRAERDLLELRREHAVLAARYEAALARAERAESEVAFLRDLARREAVA